MDVPDRQAARDAQPLAALDAGRPAVWYAQRVITKTVTGEASVPCGTCTACCRTYSAVVLQPGEPTEGLKLVPGTRQLQKQADGMRCVHLMDDGKCEVYERRPRACRDYDCRAWYFAGVMPPADDDKVEPLRRAIRRWRTHIETEDDALILYAMRRAAAALRQADPGIGFEQAAQQAFDAVPGALKRLKLEGKLRSRIVAEMREMERHTGGTMISSGAGAPPAPGAASEPGSPSAPATPDEGA
jgi:hypothetical protein